MRQKQYLQERYSAITGYISAMTTVIGIIHLVPLLLLIFYPDEMDYALSFLIAGVPLIIIGAIGWRTFKPAHAASATLQEGFVVVLLVWLIAIFSGAIPIMLIADLTFTQAVFESTSGWTTTGLSVVDVTVVPQILLFYRSLIQLAGGAGLVILALSAITGPIGSGVSAAEGRSDQLAPHVRQSLTIVIQLYSAYIIIGIIGLWLAGMSFFDAVNHAFAAISTGGFSTRPESIGYWDSVLVEAVIIVLMFAGTINFLVVYTAIRGKWQAIIRHGELRLMALVIPLVSLLLFGMVTLGLYPTMAKAGRVAVFETVSALSTTGFSTVGYGDWSEFGWFLLIIVMLIGGGTGSTAGGIKQFRIYILYKAIFEEVKRAFLPSTTINKPQLWYGNKYEQITDATVRRQAVFIGLYLFMFAIGSGVMMAHGYSAGLSLFEFASTLSTVGLSAGITAPDVPALILWTQAIGMLLGRLEFFAVIIGLVKIGRDTRKVLQS